MSRIAFQDQIPNNHCMGCGPHNERGHRIKSYWSGEGESISHFQPEPYQCAGPLEYVYGGLLASLVDCHSVCTATADAYRREGREIGEGEAIWYVTGTLNLRYVAPTRIDREIELRAKVQETDGPKTKLLCTVYSEGEPTVRAEVIAIRVPPDWSNRASSVGLSRFR